MFAIGKDTDSLKLEQNEPFYAVLPEKTHPIFSFLSIRMRLSKPSGILRTEGVEKSYARGQCYPTFIPTPQTPDVTQAVVSSQ